MMRSRYFALALALIPLPALAQTVPATPWSARPLLDTDGKPIIVPTERPTPADPTCLKCATETMTLGTAVANCLVKDAGGSPSLYDLAMRVMQNKVSDLKTNEIHAITTCVDKLAPLVSGQVDPAVDPTFKFAPVQ